MRPSHKRTLFQIEERLRFGRKLLFYNRFSDSARLAFALKLSIVIAIQIFTV
jgi:hypothetical protein